MQFNPACLSGTTTNSNVNCGQSQGTEYIPTNNLPTNNLPNYSEPPGTHNGWPNIYSSLPFYGIYNSSLVAVPTSTEAPQVSNIPVLSPNIDINKKKVALKRSSSQSDILSGENDKTQSLDEEQKMKRQRRLLKNREAAQQFRQRQKEYIQNLERKVTELNTHVGETHKHIELLSTENRLLRDQLVYLYNVMRQNLTLSPTSPSGSSSSFPISISPSTAPPMPAPSAAIDLGLLGFKGFGILDNVTGYEEMLKNASNPAMQQMMGQSPAMGSGTPVPSPSITPTMTPSGSPSITPMASPRIPDLAALSLAKGMVMETCDGMPNSMLIARFGNLIKTDHEAQTVPELAVKTEGGGGNM